MSSTMRTRLQMSIKIGSNMKICEKCARQIPHSLTKEKAPPFCLLPLTAYLKSFAFSAGRRFYTRKHCLTSQLASAESCKNYWPKICAQLFTSL